jgi:hypothetical protein
MAMVGLDMCMVLLTYGNFSESHFCTSGIGQQIEKCCTGVRDNPSHHVILQCITKDSTCCGPLNHMNMCMSFELL